ncbi:MAG: energy-coupling factor transport system permease protein [Solirubrobacteraceae bacterium]|jgi:energy-coupling factor transport system permease protein|nr:energy-coupling factor transport system permease protein [Solirubrobacteraceae bacterium]
MSAPGSVAAIAYRRRASPLHAARATVAGAYGAALAASALLVAHPLLLGALALAVLAAGAAAGVGRELVRAVRTICLPMVVLTVLVNVLVSRGGLTVFARLGDWGVLGQENLTVEAVVYGLVFSLRLLVLTLACLLIVCAADPDELLAAFRRVSPRSALTAALSTRLLPILLADSRRLAEAQRCRPDGGARGARGRLTILRAAFGGALERSLDLAAVLEMRGYGAHRRRGARARAWSRHDLAFAAAALALLGAALLGTLHSVASFHAYPLVSAPVGAATLVLAAAIVAIALAPFADRRGIER